MSTDPTILAQQLNAIHPFEHGPQSALRAVADVYSWHSPSLDVRAALLTVLYNTDGLLSQRVFYAGTGHQGAAISATADGTRDTVLFDPITGRLIVHETVWLSSPTGAQPFAPGLISHVHYLEHGRRPQPG